MKKVIVSGMGSINALGNNVTDFWNGLITNRSGIVAINGFSKENLRNNRAGEIQLQPQLLEYAESLSISSRLILFTCWAIDQAIKDSGLTIEELNQKRIGIVLGTSLGMSLVESTIQYTPDSMAYSDNLAENLSLISDELSKRYAVSGEVLITSTACASGSHAIGLAKDMILNEDYDVIICGGADTLDRVKYLGHTALNTLTASVIRPFDSSRNGTLFGEGAGFIVLEKEEALSRKVPYAVCSGIGYSCDAYHVTTPDPNGRGAIQAMNQALMDALLSPEEINYINLHGSGTALNDSIEGHAIGIVFGARARNIPVTSIKAAIGHTMGAAGALEAIATIKSIEEQVIPVTLNVNTVDPKLEVNLVYEQPRECSITHAMSNSFGFGGSNGVLIFSQP